MDQENFAKLLAAKYWPTMVVKHTVGGSCNFQQAANELAELVSAAERERWQQVAKAVIESHDAAVAYVYERLRSQGVGSITIPDSVAAEIRAVNALRELVQPNA